MRRAGAHGEADLGAGEIGARGQQDAMVYQFVDRFADQDGGVGSLAGTDALHQRCGGHKGGFDAQGVQHAGEAQGGKQARHGRFLKRWHAMC